MARVKYGGRQKGTRNVINRTVEESAKRLGINFFESLCHYANGDWKSLGYEAEHYISENASGATKINYVISPEMRLNAIIQGCKYLYSPKTQKVDLTSDGEGIKIVIEDRTKK